MKGFEPVALAWGGEQFTVAAERQLMLIARIEDALAGETGDNALQVLSRKGGPPYSRLAAAYGAALRYAGAGVSDEEIYLTISEQLSENRAEAIATIQAAIFGLFAILSPPVARKAALSGDAGKKPAAASGKRQSTRRKKG
jgi:hypothetical protein